MQHKGSAVSLQAVASLHSNHVAWRDAAPGNVQCTGADTTIDPGVVVFDFSLSVVMQAGMPHMCFKLLLLLRTNVCFKQLCSCTAAVVMLC